MTSGADHLTGNLEPCELVYWSSRTSLRWTQQTTHHYINDCSGNQINTQQFHDRCSKVLIKTYLVMPKSETFTSLFFETRQFLAACARTEEGWALPTERNKSCITISSYQPVYQISVDEVGALQVRHPLTDIQTHPQQRILRQTALPGPQVVRQAAVLHELKQQTHGSVVDAHTVELH